VVLNGQVAIVTGGAQGIGAAIARRLAADGARLAIFDLNGDGARSMADELGGSAHAMDVTDEQAVNDSVAAVVAEYARVDILVNNAGIYPYVPFDELTFAEWRHVLATNLDATFLCSHAVAPHMRQRGYGRIVNLSSDTVLLGLPGLSAYVAAKAGVIGFTRTLANELGPDGVTVNAVLPGLVGSETVLRDLEHMFDLTIQQQAIKQRGEPADIAECVAYLTSPSAGFITGQSLAVNGGQRFV
jgi:NAD(P)-dependent dehydrogenase (short-subunit alcohol dehydrogenase family)